MSGACRQFIRQRPPTWLRSAVSAVRRCEAGVLRRSQTARFSPLRCTDFGFSGPRLSDMSFGESTGPAAGRFSECRRTVQAARRSPVLGDC